MNSTALREILSQERKTDAEWTAGLNERKRAELEFHDKDRDPNWSPEREDWKEFHANKRWYSVAGISEDYTSEWIKKNAKGKIFLDYACGNGQYTVKAAAAGAELAIGLDISPVSVENARRKAASMGLSSNTLFIQGDCENTGLPDNSVDAILCAGMLHHLDLSYAFPELRRIMKPGAVLHAAEPLKYNPLIQAYRWLTPNMRTDWEKRHILTIDDLRLARRFFELRDLRFWHLFCLGATPLRKTPLFRPALAVGHALDSVALRIPGFRLMAWKMTFELVKRPE